MAFVPQPQWDRGTALIRWLRANPGKSILDYPVRPQPQPKPKTTE